VTPVPAMDTTATPGGVMDTGQMVWYIIKESRACTEQDYSDFLRRTRWKEYQAKHRRTNVGNYLEIL
jgi:hypothetical protein